MACEKLFAVTDVLLGMLTMYEQILEPRPKTSSHCRSSVKASPGSLLAAGLSAM